MEKEQEQKIKDSVAEFKLPRYNEIPEIGLFLEQTTNFINDKLKSLDVFSITPTMISNYVKKKIIANPSGKTYSRDQIAYLISTTVFKNVLSLSDIATMFEIQKNEYTVEVAYNYFCEEFENILQYAFGNKKHLEKLGSKPTKSKELLRNALNVLVYKIYLSKYLEISK